MSRIAADPQELRRTADRLRETALAYVSTAHQLQDPLPLMPPEIAGVVGSNLASTAADLRRLSRVTIDQAQDLALVAFWFEIAGRDDLGAFTLLEPLAQSQLATALTLLGTSADAAALSTLTVDDWLGVDVANADVVQIAGAFTGLSGAQTAFLAERYPDIIGPLDGAPIGARFAANDILIDRAIADLEAQTADLRTRIETMRAEMIEAYQNIPPGTRAGPGPFMEIAMLDAELAALETKLALFRDMATPGRNFLLFDPSGDGLAAEVLGNLKKADHVAVLVPGMNTDIGDFAGFSADAEALLEQARDFGSGGVATIAWLGYDTPTARDVAFSGDAEDGGRLLDRFIDGLRQHVDPHVTAVAHSYGGVVAGHSLRYGLDVDDAVFIGAPGTGWFVEDASELNTDARLWAGKNPFPKEFVPSLPGHGEDPTEEDFGATRFQTNAPGYPEIEGHSSYYQTDSASLYNIGAIVSGNGDVVGKY